MGDDEWEESLFKTTKNDGMSFHEICKWSPYKEETIDKIADNMVRNGYDKDQPIVTYEGAILDGRHRYVAAQKVGVDPITVEFHGTRQEAIDFVTMRQVDRGHWNSQEKEYFYVKRAEALGVRKREDSLKQNTTDPQNCETVPSAKEHADALGVHVNTVSNWEKDRKEIMSDPDLSFKTDTFEGYRGAKQKLKEKRNEAKKKIQNSVPPNVVDLNAIAKDTKNTDLQNVGPAFIALMEKLCSKFDDSDIKKELSAFMYPDPIGLKVDALHKMTNILTDLCVDFPVKKLKNLN